MKKLNQWILITLLGISIALPSIAQEQDTVDLYELSLEELMKIPINSASKRDETLFDAPLSSYTITRAEIIRSGATSIMEALRLAPGVIVREQTNGTYDIHIRGFDNILRTSGDYTKSNLITLVMIDNRPVFNHNIGGTFWESLTVDVNDVERIEIVRGPSAPLFGPNAVSGVINIITRKLKDETAQAYASVQGGNSGTLLANASVLQRFGKWSAGVSGNFQQRDRFDEEYYNSMTRSFEKGADFINNFNSLYPNAQRAMNKWGANAFASYQHTESTRFDLSMGLQDATVQKNFLGGNGTELTTNTSTSSYVNLNAQVHHLTVRASHTSGKDDLSKGNRPNQYDYAVSGVDAEYAFRVKELVTITPGLSFLSVAFDDEGYRVEGSNTSAGFLNRSRTINTLSAFLRSDWNLTKSWRLLAAVRADKFSTPDNTYVAFEFASTYKLNTNNLLRAAFTRSNSGSFVGLNYLAVSELTPVPGLSVTQSGNTNLDLFTITMIEAGYRTQLSSSLQLDLDVFLQRAENFAAVTAEVFNPIIGQPSAYRFNNVPVSAEQRGITLGLNYVHNDNIQFKPFVTLQRTETKDLPDSWASPSLNPALTYSSSEHKSTPSVFGGFYLNLRASKQLNVNLNGYYFSTHRQYDGADLAQNADAGEIRGKFLMNIKLNYNVSYRFSLFLNGRNILNSDSREYFGTDRTGALYLAGASYSLR